ncbi:hypothetical protein NFI96_010034 [Prochilodus magdalenae]|nr:hypothetical protein NFI96_010034 [Prochilodus magdalenae]
MVCCHMSRRPGVPPSPPLPHHLQELCEDIQAAWDGLSQDTIRNLYSSIPRQWPDAAILRDFCVADRAEYHVKAHPEGYSGTQGRKSNLLAPNGPLGPCKAQLRSSGVFGHLGGRLVMPNTGGLIGMMNFQKGAFLHLDSQVLWAKLPGTTS